MTETTRAKPDGIEMALLLGGVAAILAAYVLPAVTFTGRGGAVLGLSILDKVPLMSAVAFAALAAAVATRFVPTLQKHAETATVAAILLALAPALWGFMVALDAWSGVRATMLQMANARTVKVDPGLAYVPLALGATLLGFSLRQRLRRLAPAEAQPA
jgi:hypothetical protein